MFKSHEVEDGLSTIFAINFHASSFFSFTSDEGLQQNNFGPYFPTFKKRWINQGWSQSIDHANKTNDKNRINTMEINKNI